jgi:hypothetical protein
LIATIDSSWRYFEPQSRLGDAGKPSGSTNATRLAVDTGSKASGVLL